MPFSFARIVTVLLPAIILGCVSGEEVRKAGEKPVRDHRIKYAKRFSIARTSDLTFVYLFGDRHSGDTTETYILYKDEGALSPDQRGKENVIRVPCDNVASLSSIYTQMLFELGHLESVKAIDNIDYVNNSAVLSKFRKGELLELAKTPAMDVERTIGLDPCVVFTFGMGDGGVPDNRLAKAGIPVAVSVDHLEESPLARAEWIRFFAEFVDEGHKADSIFKATEKEYLRLKQLASGVQRKPTVFSEIRFSDAWYMPGGKSYVARLLADAGAFYLWSDNDRTGSLPLSFEEVFTRAGEADYWIHLSTVLSKKELLSYEPRYARFRAFQKGHLYNNNRSVNELGYSTYWESGMIHPERILSDMVKIFHPGLLDTVPDELYYYRHIR